MEKSIRHAAGNLLVVGLTETALTGMERAWLRLIRPGGIVLFKRNIEDAAQTRAMLDEIAAFAAPNPVRTVDVEGGTVNRLRDALAPIPSAQAVARAAILRPKAALARKHGELIARAVRAFGFNTALAPVVDLALPESESVLGTRAPSANPAQVVAYAREFITGLSAHGVAACGKHFPGLGGADGDTHFVTPEIQRTWQQLWSQDLVPYRELHAMMPMIMTNHAAYPRTRGGNHPTSASPFWITKVLRQQIGYHGIVLSDDLEMGGILKFLPVEEAAGAALRAGADLLLMCHNAELILRVYEALISEAERSAGFRYLLVARSRESERKRKRLYASGVARTLTAKQLDALRQAIARFTDAVSAATDSESVAPREISPAENR